MCPAGRNNGDVQLRRLQQFIVLAETLHFGRASERVNVSTSALSRTIRQLEGEVRCGVVRAGQPDPSN